MTIFLYTRLVFKQTDTKLLFKHVYCLCYYYHIIPNSLNKRNL